MLGADRVRTATQPHRVSLRDHPGGHRSAADRCAGQVSAAAHHPSHGGGASGFPLDTQLASLLRLVPPSRLLYGTDWPFTPQPQITESARRIAHTRLLSGDDRQLIRYRNARHLFKRFEPSGAPDLS
ncbi:amidohydrolase family protein [Streptomyces rugosispiralis]|uniref:amidohydrolase family protein n=1 Tax=Streptomyces rugosispiralis TaxID=2967341 RepID=UPI003703B3EE